jgi:hypothetical protein
MKTLKIIAGWLLASFGILIVACSMVEEPHEGFGTFEEFGVPAATFFAVIMLHWLLWRYIIPVQINAPKEVTSFLPSRSKWKVLSGTIVLGYTPIALYCGELTGLLPTRDPSGHFGSLILGLFVISLGMADRLRNVFLALSTSLDSSHSQSHTFPLAKAE